MGGLTASEHVKHDLLRGPAGISCSQCTLWVKTPPDWNDVGNAYDAWNKELR